MSIKIISTVEKCKEAVRNLKESQEISLDIEGFKLCREGRISIIQAKGGNHTYLIDITVLGKVAFEEGGLKEVLESERIEKVMYDCRADGDALWHLYGVKLKNVYDVQVLYTWKFNSRTDRFLKGLKKAHSQYGISAEDRRSKNAGLILFERDSQIWERRPLDPVLVKYASVDVKYLLDMKRRWGSSHMNANIKETSKERLESAINSRSASRGPQNARVDFSYREYGLEGCIIIMTLLMIYCSSNR